MCQPPPGLGDTNNDVNFVSDDKTTLETINYRYNWADIPSMYIIIYLFSFVMNVRILKRSRVLRYALYRRVKCKQSSKRPRIN